MPAAVVRTVRLAFFSCLAASFLTARDLRPASLPSEETLRRVSSAKWPARQASPGRPLVSTATSRTAPISERFFNRPARRA